MMATQYELAVFAYNCYRPEDENFIAVDGWALHERLSSPLLRGPGFDGSVFYRGSEFAPSEIVIAFRGTDGDMLGPALLDWATGNIPAAAGYDWGQVYDAIRLVADTMAEYPHVPIKFTGHSLGGGLASLMSIFFGVEAFTFDSAPFQLSATGMQAILTPFAIELLDSELVEELYSYYELYQRRNFNEISPEFRLYRDILATENRILIDEMFWLREQKVNGSYLNGEVLEALRLVLPTIVGSNGLTEVDIGETTLGMVELHSMLLLAAMELAPDLAEASRRYPALAALLLDETLYGADKRSDQQSFLTRMVAAHMAEGGVPGTGILDRFGDDLLRLGAAGATNHELLRSALTSLVIEYYNFVDPQDTDAFIGTETDAIVFDPSGMSGRGHARLLDGAVAFADSRLSGQILAAAETATEWRIHTGTEGLETTGTAANEVQIGSWLNANHLRGGAGNDVLIDGLASGTLEGEAGNDILIGGHAGDTLYGGDDTDYLDGGGADDSLYGGSGSDLLYGGEGADNYYFSLTDGADIIEDSDGQGVIYIDGLPLEVGTRIGENTWQSSDGQLTLTRQLGPLGVLVITNETGTLSITVRQWVSGRLGITLNEGDDYAGAGETAGDVVPPALPPVTWPPESTTVGTGSVTSYLDFDNVHVGAAAGRLFGLGTDRLFGLGGNDALVGGDGDDYLDGGAGSDLLFGGAGRDLLTGGADSDFIIGDRDAFDVGSAIGSDPGVVYVSLTGNVAYHGLGWGIEITDPSTFITSYLLYGAATTYVAGGADIIDAGGGNDFVLGGDGDDVISGGDGDDEIIGEAGDDNVQGGVGEDVILGDGQISDGDPDVDLLYSPITAQGRDVLHGGDNNDIIVGGGNADRLYGDEGNDELFGDHVVGGTVAVALHGDDLLDGGVGNDFLTGDGGNDTLYGGEDADTMRGDADVAELDGQYHGSDFLSGDGGNDSMKGGGGADRLFGGAGDDLMFGDEDGSGGAALSAEYQGNDFLDGGADNDTIHGGGGADRVYGGTGNDVLFGDQSGISAAAQGDDYIDGGEGVDQIIGGGGRDTLIGGTGNDHLEGDNIESLTPFAVHGDDHIDGGDGDDVVYGWGGKDYILGGSGVDHLIGDASTAVMGAIHHGNDYIAGGTGNDFLWGMGGNDVLYGNEDDDQLDGDDGADTSLAGDDVIDGGSGNDQMWGRGGNDVLIGGLGNDSMFGNGGNDQLSGDEGNDEMAGGAGDDVLNGGSGADVIDGGDGADVMDGGVGNDTILGGAGDDVIYGGLGVDVLRGGAGDDTYIFHAADMQVSGSLTDGIIDTEGSNRVVLEGGMTSTTVSVVAGVSAGSVNLISSDGTLGLVLRDALSGSISSIEFSDGVSMTAAELLGTRLDAFAGQESEANSVSLYGGLRADSITGWGNNVIISGGRGNDLLIGGGGNTTYVFARGDGNDTITDQSTFQQQGNRNVLELGEGITLSDLQLSATIGTSGATLALGGTDSVLLSAFSLVDPVNGSRTLDEIRFSDGTSITWDALVAQRGIAITNPGAVASYTATAFNDRITGAAIAETINAGAGDDVIDGGGGNDVLSGGLGSDIYVLRQGSGADTINNFDSAGGKTDRLVIDASIASADVEFIRIAQSLLVRVRGTSDQVMISDYFDTAGLDEIVLGDGTVYTAGNVPWQAQPDNVLTYNQGGGPRTFGIADPVGLVSDVLRFGANVDPSSVAFSSNANGDLVIRFRDPSGGYVSGDVLTITGAVGDGAARLDRIEFEAVPGMVFSAQDILYRAGTPTEQSDGLFGSTQSDIINGRGGDDVILGRGGDDVLHGGAGHDSVDGGDGNDTLTGGAGADLLTGGAGNDTFLINLGDEDDTIYAFDSDAQANDVLIFGAGVNPDSIRLSFAANDLYVFYLDPLAARPLARISGFLSLASAGYTIDEVRFTDAPGVVWSAADLLSRITGPSAGPNEIYGTFGNDTLLGLAGNDTLNGLLGDDDLRGGLGNDLLIGGDGNDTFRYDRGDGIDSISDNGAGTNRIVLGAGILPADLTLIKTYIDFGSGADLVLMFDDEDQIRISGYYVGSPNIATIEFANGTVWTAADIAARIVDRTGDANTQTGTSGNDTFTVDNVMDVIEQGGSGTDSVYASVSYTLQENGVENLYLQGTGHFSAQGNSLDNILGGNSGDNVLDGRGGADTLMGGAGDDTYYVNGSFNSSPNDTVVESANGGYDTVISTASGGSLAANVERLIVRLSGTWGPNAAPVTGNELDNEISVEWTDSFTFDRNVIIDGGAGADRMLGSALSETYVVDNVGDQVIERGGNGPSQTDTVRSYISYQLPDLIEQLVLMGSAAITGTGNDFANRIDGSGNSAANTLIGRAGDDRYVLGAGDTIVEFAGEGIDTVVLSSGALSSSLADYANVENIELDSAALSSATGNSGDNRIVGNFENNVLSGGAGADTILDSPNFGFDTDTLNGGEGNDTLISLGGLDQLIGGAGDDQLLANAGSGGGARFVFGHGSDYDSASIGRVGAAVVFDSSVATNDVRMTRDGRTVYVYVGTTARLQIDIFTDATSWTFAPSFGQFEFSNGTVWGAAQVQALIQASGSPLPSATADVVVGTSVRDRIDGMAGDDTLSGLAGDDRLDGNIGNDQLSGGGGADELTGGAGNDVLIGGAGGDSYYFSADFGRDVIRDTEAGQVQDAAIDRVVFDATITRDEVVFSRSETDPADLWVTRRGTGDRLTVENFYADPADFDHIEQFVFADGTIVTSDFLRGVPTIEGTPGADNLQASAGGSTLNGYGGNDTLTGSNAADTLDGGAGVDTMTGGGGDDLYRVDNIADVVTEANNGGQDRIFSTVAFELSNHVESLELGGHAAIDATGNALDNHLTGNDAANILDGRAGADTMAGGAGNDTYIVDNSADVVVERDAEGYDTVNSYVSHSLGNSVEVLTLVGTADVDGTGNAGSNYIRGNAGSNLLDGGAGADTLVGAQGNDTYVVDDIGDVVVEAIAQGSDTIEASVSYRAAENVETLHLTGSGAINATGNALDNSLVGNAAANTLDGELGADQLRGGAGNDIYIVDHAGDVTIEFANEGDDQVISSVDLTLADNIERLRMTGGALTATGNALNNIIEGNSQSNLIDGGAGDDTMSGGAGDDVYIVDSAGDVATEFANAGTDTVHSNVTFTLGANVENLVLTGSGAIDGTGNSLANSLTGNAAANTLIGGAGDDIYVTDGNDTLFESFGEGTDLVRSSATHTLLANFEDLELQGTANLDGTGNASNNRIVGNVGNNTLDGGGAADALLGGAGDDLYIVDNAGDVVTEADAAGVDTVQSEVTFELGEHVEHLTLTGFSWANGTGNSLDNTLIGNAGFNALNGGAGNDVLDGGAGDDALAGGEGNDTYFVAEIGDTVTEALSQGSDTVFASVSFTLGANIENLTLTGVDALDATGNASNNSLVGNDANNTLDGGQGADTLTGGLGDDTYRVDSTFDAIVEAANAGTDHVFSSASHVLAANVENLTLIGTAAINGTGNALDNLIVGNTAINVLTGGAGNDTYIVENSGDTIVENASEGTDLVQASVTYALSDHIETLVLTGTAAINGTGNSLGNDITGNTSDNVLNGGAGADTLIGGLGNDTYVIDSLSDVIVEASDEGIDTVLSSVSHVLAATFEHLTLIGAANIDATGNALDNTLTGNSSNNRLDGGAGIDTMIGGAGNDTYVVESEGELVIEDVGAGTDTVQTSLTYILGENVENLVLTGNATVNGTGNALANALTGNSADNVLDGGAGADTLVGGLGNDTYVLDDEMDVVTEAAGQGTDLIRSSVTHTLEANVEELTLEGFSAVDAIGNGLANVLTGNAANNVLDGRVGADTLLGGYGDDTYIVDNVNDVVTEYSWQGNDVVIASVTYSLGEEVEELTLTGSSAINGVGNALYNILRGNSAANTLDGGLGIDTLIGGGGNDIYVVDDFYDVVSELAGEGMDLVRTTVTYALSSDIENLTLIGSAAINGTGNEITNTITGNVADNVLDGGAGSDALIGGAGNDTYIVDNIGDTVTELTSGGLDVVYSAVSYSLALYVENMILTGDAAVNATGNTLANELTGNIAANTLDGGTGADRMLGGSGDDIYVVDNALDQVVENWFDGTDLVRSSITHTLADQVENLTLTLANAINGTGNDLSNVITGNGAANTLNGMAGADTLIGGLGNDIYVVDDVNDVVVEAAASGTDLVQATTSYTLSDNVENLTLLAGYQINGTGNALVNTLTGNALDNVLDGAEGNDTLIGGAGNDTYYVDGADIITEGSNAGTDNAIASVTYTLATNVENLTLAGIANIDGAGNALVNILNGNAGNNTLNGFGGADSMIGGFGDDIYVVDNVLDVITEYYGEGVDTIQSAVTYTLGQEVENLTLTGTTAAINGNGNELANILTGNAGNNSLDGKGGADSMIGGLGNDTYFVDDLGDIVTEGAAGGTDIVRTTVSYTLGAELETLVLIDGYVTNATGNAQNNTLTGNSLDNVLDGGGGGDSMSGGAGNDTYVTDGGDTISETAGNGTDTVNASVTYTLGSTSNLENLTLTGTAAIDATGNTLANVLIGNSANNTLTGGTGADVMSGGAGNDTYNVDNVGDTVYEAAGEGIDLVQSSVAFTLADDVENLTLTLSSGVTGTGNNADNVLTGNTGANTLYGNGGNDTLNGAGGNDTMYGGVGDDVYFVDATGDNTNENADEGMDTVNSSVTKTLAAHIELLFLTGTNVINGTGNTLSNLLRGNSMANTLAGGGGFDILEGGAGNDILSNATGTALFNGGADADTMTGAAGNDMFIGGTGNDTITTGAGADVIAFNRGDGQDTINVSTGTDNTVSLGGGALYADLLFTKSGNNLILQVGASDQMTFVDYYANPSNRSVANLQMVIEGTSDYDSGSSDVTRDNKIETFDFAALVADFDAARAVDPNLTSWALSSTLLSRHLTGSDSAAIGGDLAYRYHRFGNLADISFVPGVGLLSAPEFGSSAQPLLPLAGLQDTSARLQ